MLQSAHVQMKGKRKQGRGERQAQGNVKNVCLLPQTADLHRRRGLSAN